MAKVYFEYHVILLASSICVVVNGLTNEVYSQLETAGQNHYQVAWHSCDDVVIMC